MALVLCAVIWLVGCGERKEMPLSTANEETVDHTLFADAGLEVAVRAALGQPRGNLTASLLLYTIHTSVFKGFMVFLSITITITLSTSTIYI